MSGCSDASAQHDNADPHHIETHRRPPFSEIHLPRQTHSLNVGILTEVGMDCPDTDALITRLPGVAIGVRTADCVPILLHAPDIGAVAAIHAGWRGTLGGIVDATLARLRELGANPGGISAIFGASISAEAYEVDEDLAEQFREAGFGRFISYPAKPDFTHQGVTVHYLADEPAQSAPAPKPHIDLEGINVCRLICQGVGVTGITPSPWCTLLSKMPDGSPRFNSYRRDHTAARNITAIVLNKPAPVTTGHRFF